MVPRILTVAEMPAFWAAPRLPLPLDMLLVDLMATGMIVQWLWGRLLTTVRFLVWQTQHIRAIITDGMLHWLVALLLPEELLCMDPTLTETVDRCRRMTRKMIDLIIRALQTQPTRAIIMDGMLH